MQSNTPSRYSINTPSLIFLYTEQITPSHTPSHTPIPSLPFSSRSQYLSALLKQHVEETGSARAARALANIDEAMSKCWLVLPAAEKKNPVAISSDASVKNAAEVVV